MTNLARFAAWLLAISALPSIAAAQFSTVMLPSQHRFGVSTSVMVPDGGGMLLGGVNRLSSGQVRRGFGPFTNQAFGRSVGASTASVHVYVIDLGEIDRRMQEEAAAMREASYYQYVMSYPKVAQASKLTTSVRGERAELAQNQRVRSGLSLAAQRQLAEEEDAAAAAEQLAEAVLSFQKASEAETKRQFAAAKKHFLVAAKKGDEKVRREALDGYRRVTAASSIAQANSE